MLLLFSQWCFKCRDVVMETIILMICMSCGDGGIIRFLRLIQITSLKKGPEESVYIQTSTVKIHSFVVSKH